MSGFIAFLLLVVAMGIGTLICGFVPLSLPLSHRMMRVLEVFGAGLLVGAAVTVVIPEASSALFSNVTPTPHAEINTLATNILHPHIALTITSQPQTASIHTHPAPQPWAWSFITKRFTPDSPHDLDNHHEHDHQHQPLNHAKTFSSEDAEHRLGSSILFGIVLMYVIDQFISGSGTSSIHNHDEPQDTAASNHSHHHQHSTQPTRPRLETHRLSKSFHQKVDPTAAPNAIRKVSSRASFTFFDRAQHAMTQQDEEAQIGSRAAQHGHTRKDGTHRSIESIATTCSSSDHDLPDDYDDESSHQHPHLSRLASDSVSDWNTTPLDRNGGGDDQQYNTTESSSAPLLDHRSNSFTSTTTRPPLGSRSFSSSSTRTTTTTTTTTTTHFNNHSSSLGHALTTIVGLLIHAVADGIAMGASAQSGDQTLTMVVFVAIMVHKAPAAFGLCAMLMSQRLSRISIRKAVAVFALASPMGALITYAALALFFDSDISTANHNLTTAGGGGGGGAGIDGKSIGTALAFSGGTFLFVAFHAVLELAGVEADVVSMTNNIRRGEIMTRNAETTTMILGKWFRIVLLILGACTPRFLQGILAGLGGQHHHHH